MKEKKMQDRKAFFSVAITAAALLLAGTVAMADGNRGWHPVSNVPTPAPSPPPTSCSTSLFDVRVTSGPTFVPCDAPGGQCTEIEYEVTPTPHKGKKPRQVFVLEGVGVWDVLPKGSRWFGPCDGIPCGHDSGFGRNACHEQAIQIDTRGGPTRFTVILAGLRRSNPTSVAALKHGHHHDVEACTILGIGLEGGPNKDQLTQTTETVDFKGCVVEFTRDPVTGDVVKAQLTEDSPLSCEGPSLDAETGVIAPRPVAEVEVLVNGQTLGFGKFGDGTFSTGTDSCTTRVIGARVYTWGAPCP